MPTEEAFEHLVTRLLAERITEARGRELSVFKASIGPNDAVEFLVRLIADEARAALAKVTAEQDEDETAAVVAGRQLAVCNAVLGALRTSAAGYEPDQPVSPYELLRAITPSQVAPKIPLSGLSQTLLLTGRSGLRLGTELASEFRTASEADAIVSFVRRSGYRALSDALEQFSLGGKSFRLITTTYTGASEVEALCEIAKRPKAEVKVSYDTRRSRLHAKAWLFRRPNRLTTAFVGSANLSAAALDTGLEWTLKASEYRNPEVIGAFRTAFDTLWEDGEFETFRADDDDAVGRLRRALAAARGERPSSATAVPEFFFDLQPYPFQQVVLDRLKAERERGHTRNLVVSATGTGKTVIAAFDYRRLVAAHGVRPRMLFIAHRDEILAQACRTFREVLRDHSFGERLGGGAEPRSWDHVFASIQSVGSRNVLQRFGVDYWDYVVVDEIHRGAADSYRPVLDAISPRHLLGLTATPERTDGQDILHWFGDAPTAEIRLWDALDRSLLAPFDYFAVHDGTDLRQIEWARGGYDLGRLSNLYTGNDRRADLILRQFRDKYGDLHRARALGFCVSVEHAEFMAERFRVAGISAEAVHGMTPVEKRTNAPERLAAREVNVLFTCDLYNEGVDIPEVDVLLLLRPTESVLLFQQQLGRGLRLHPEKASVLVLDFIGQCRREFRFGDRLRALTGLPGNRLVREIEEGFPVLPLGCSVDLDRVAQKIILENVRNTVRAWRVDLVADFQAVASRTGTEKVTLARFLAESGRELSDVYSKSVGGWTTLRRVAGMLPGVAPVNEVQHSQSLSGVLHADDPELIDRWIELIDGAAPQAETEDGRRLLMLARRVLPSSVRPESPALFIDQLDTVPEVKAELRELLSFLRGRCGQVRPAAGPVPPGWLVAPDRHYARDEILAAVGAATWTGQPPSREGLFRLQEQQIELFFVTLDKSDDSFTPSTKYEDYAISDRLFHWQSQSGTSEESPTGLRYRGQAGERWAFHLFVRERRKDKTGKGAAFVYLGPLQYIKHEGSRPMSITWALSSPIPPHLVETFVRYRTA